MSKSRPDLYCAENQTRNRLFGCPLDCWQIDPCQYDLLIWGGFSFWLWKGGAGTKDENQWLILQRKCLTDFSSQKYWSDKDFFMLEEGIFTGNAWISQQSHVTLLSITWRRILENYEHSYDSNSRGHERIHLCWPPLGELKNSFDLSSLSNSILSDFEISMNRKLAKSLPYFQSQSGLLRNEINVACSETIPRDKSEPTLPSDIWYHNRKNAV
jgi:hypothetical protein